MFLLTFSGCLAKKFLCAAAAKFGQNSSSTPPPSFCSTVDYFAFCLLFPPKCVIHPVPCVSRHTSELDIK